MNGRRTESTKCETFKKFNIYLDLENIEKEIVDYNLEQYREIYITSLQNAVKTLESLLTVENCSYPFKLYDENITNINISIWNKSKFGTNATNNDITSKTLDIDLVIFGRFEDVEGLTLAYAGARYLNSEGRPIVGVVTINKLVDYSKRSSKEYLQSIIIHEFTHILGFNNDFFKDFFFLVNKADKYGIN